jgi:hypothetical protein
MPLISGRATVCANAHGTICSPVFTHSFRKLGLNPWMAGDGAGSWKLSPKIIWL